MKPVLLALLLLPGLAQSQPKPQFEVASIKPCNAGDAATRGPGGVGHSSSPDRLDLPCQTPISLIRISYTNFPNGHFSLENVPIEGAPVWITSERYRIDAKAQDPVGQSMMLGPMLQALLEDRFQLKVHREARQVPVYELTIAKGGIKFKPSQEGSCTVFDYDHPPPSGASSNTCGVMHPSNNNELDAIGFTMMEFARTISAWMDRPVIDQTGLQGRFDIRLDVATQDLAHGGVRPNAAPDSPDPMSALFAAVRGVGLRLDAAKGPQQFLVIDHIERPSAN